MTAVPQHMHALQLANEIRLTNATFRRTVMAMPPRKGAEHVADTVEHDYADDALGAFPMDRLLSCIRRFGPQKTDRCLHVAGVPTHHRRLRDLTPRQRKAVAAQIRLWGAGYRS